MKILLCSANSKYIHSSLGVWYLFAASKTINHNHDVEVVETTINNHVEDVITKLIEKKPDVIGFSCYIWNIDFILKVAQVIRQINPEIKIFFGGPEASFNAEKLIEYPYVDLIIKGEGELPFIKLVEEEFVTEENVIIQGVPVHKYISPYTKEYFEALQGRICYIETSRGCPFSCGFCLSGRNETVRFFDYDQAKQNIINLANSGTKTVKFVDRTFNCNDKRAKEIFSFIVENYNNGTIPKDIIFHFEVEADLFSIETLEYLQTVPKGLFQFEAGLQSFNKQTLQAVNRRSDIQHLVSNLVKIVEGGNIHLHIDLIAGLPYENYESFIEGFNLAYAVNAHVIQLGFLKLLKGSELEKEKEKYDYKYWDYAPYQVIENHAISYEDLVKLKKAEDAVDKLLNSGKFTSTIKYILQQTSWSAYDLFYNFGEYIYNSGIKNPSLELYSKIFYEYFSGKENINPKILRDKLAFDFITTDRGGKLYSFIHVFDDRLKNISINLKNGMVSPFADTHQKAKSGKIGFAIDYTTNETEELVTVVDYTSRNPVTGVYDYKVLNISEFLIKD